MNVASALVYSRILRWVEIHVQALCTVYFSGIGIRESSIHLTGFDNSVVGHNGCRYPGVTSQQESTGVVVRVRDPLLDAAVAVVAP